MPSLDALRARHGLPALARFSDLLERPPLLLALTAEGFEYPCSTEHQRDKRLVHVALEALPAAGMSVIATTAAHDPDEFGAPPRSRVVRFVPHDAQRRPRASASQIAGR
jgi:hypothetical protein